MTDINGAGAVTRSRWKRLHMGWKVLAAAVVLFAAYSVFGFFVAPSIIQSKLTSSLESAFKRPVHVGKVSFNPYTLKMDVEEVRISRKDTDGFLVSLEDLHVDLEHFSIVEWAIVLGELRLVRPEVNLVYREDGTYNVSDLMAGDDGNNGNGGVFPFVLRSFAVEGGKITFQDRVLNKTHRVEDLDLNIPFASTLPEDVAAPVQPALSARVNGTPVSLAGKVLPFAEPLSAEFEFKIQGSDLTHYWAYAPLPDVVELKSGRLSANAAMVFEQGENILPRLYFRGDYHLEDVALAGRGGADILGFKSLDLKLNDVGVFDRVIRAETLEVRSPYLAVTRLEDGGFDWEEYLPLARADAGPAEDGPDEAGKDLKPALHLEAKRLTVTGGQVDFRDLCVPGGFEYRLSPVWVSAENVNTADEAPARLTASFGENGKALISVSADFGVQPLQADGAVTVSNLNPVDFKAYYAEFLPLEISSGALGGTVEFVVPAGQAAQSSIETFNLELSGLALAAPDEKDPRIEIPLLRVRGGPVDPAKRVVTVDEVLAEIAGLDLTRGEDGMISPLAAFQAGEKDRAENEPAVQSGAEGEGAETGAHASEEGGPAGAEWDLSVRSANVSVKRAVFEDKAAPRPGRIEVRDLAVTLSDFKPEEGREAPFSISARPADGGEVTFEGSMTFPGSVSGEIEIKSLSLLPASIYLPEASSLALAGGTLSAGGRLAAGTGETAVSYEGGFVFSDVSVRDRTDGGNIISFAGLDLDDVRIQGAPFDVRIAGVELEGLEGRYAVGPGGESNWNSALAGFGGEEESAGGQGEGGLESLTVGSVKLKDGLLRYSDDSVSPAFNTELSSLNVEIDDLALSPKQRSRLKAGGMIGGDAPVSAEGLLNIMRAGAETEMKVSIENLALPPLTPYSVKYIGYPLTKGKLYADVDFSIREMALEAQNHFRIEQLEVGGKVESETAADVPIKLAMSLLTDGSGTMALDVPVQGRLDDPQFKLGKVIFKAVGSLFGKIVTAPFAFIGAIFGGEGAPENVGVLEFSAGSNDLNETHERKLGAVAKAMSERPRIRLEISGYADPHEDAMALEGARMEELVREQKIKAMGASAPDDPSQVTVSPEEYPAYLRFAFREVTGESPGDRPAGILKELLRQYVTITEDDLRGLARSRSTAARNFLTGIEDIEPGRIFIKEHDQLAEPAEDGIAHPRVELGLGG